MINRELAADFDVAAFDHVALWDPSQERMDLRLRVNGDHTVTVDVTVTVSVGDIDTHLDLYDGEEIRTEISTNFRIPPITTELAAAGFTSRQVWTNPPGDVAVLLASVDR